jgi:hypothetical protein
VSDGPIIKGTADGGGYEPFVMFAPRRGEEVLGVDADGDPGEVKYIIKNEPRGSYLFYWRSDKPLPADNWYELPGDEYLCVLEGELTLTPVGGYEPVVLGPGDSAFFARGTRYNATLSKLPYLEVAYTGASHPRACRNERHRFALGGRARQARTRVRRIAAQARRRVETWRTHGHGRARHGVRWVRERDFARR